jgi:hypothetical protein
MEEIVALSLRTNTIGEVTCAAGTVIVMLADSASRAGSKFAATL